MASICHLLLDFYHAHLVLRSVWGLSIWYRCAASSASTFTGSLLIYKLRHRVRMEIRRRGINYFTYYTLQVIITIDTI